MAVSEDSLIVPNRGGRPRISSEPLTPVTIWITQGHYDRLTKLASLHDESLSCLGRKVLERVIDRAID
jgi:hypothetical protein